VGGGDINFHGFFIWLIKFNAFNLAKARFFKDNFTMSRN